jgi:hypothetical protein
MRGVGLGIPSSLVVTAIVACGPQIGPDDDSVGDTSEDETSSTTRDDTTTADPSTTTIDPSTTTVDPGTTEVTTDDQTTGPIELPDCSVHSYVAECNDEDLCTWQTDVGCVIECPVITDEAQCVSFDHCEWFGSCQFAGAI